MVDEPNHTICNIVMQNPNAPTNTKIECVLARVFWLLADAQLVGPLLVTPILPEILPNQH